VKEHFYATCTPGLEFISAGEIEGKKLGRVSEIRESKGKVFFKSSFSKIPLLNCCLRSVERIVLVFEKENVKSLDEIYKVVRNLDLDFIKQEWSFAVRSTRVGNHDFTSVDISRVSGQAIIDSFTEKKGVRLKVNLDEPDVTIRCDLFEDELIVGLDTTGDEGLHKRRYRIYQHPAPLNPVIASSLVYLSGWRGRYSLLDPFCGSGTILFEAGMIARETPVCKFRDDFAFKRFFDSVPEISERDVKLKLFGVERFEKHLKGARKIAEFVGIDVTFLKGLAEKIDEYFDEVDFIITNPPYGLRIGKKKVIERIYTGFLKSASKVLREKAVVITAEKELFERLACDYFSKTDEYEIRYGGLNAGVYVLRD